MFIVSFLVCILQTRDPFSCDAMMELSLLVPVEETFRDARFSEPPPTEILSTVVVGTRTLNRVLPPAGRGLSFRSAFEGLPYPQSVAPVPCTLGDYLTLSSENLPPSVMVLTTRQIVVFCAWISPHVLSVMLVEY